MKAITIKQPWARAIATGGKNVENRGRGTNHRGLIAIHTSKTIDPTLNAYYDPRIAAALNVDTDLLARADALPALPTLGAVIAVADLVGCHRAMLSGPVRPGGDPHCCCEPWGEPLYRSPRGARDVAYHLVLDNVRALWRPVYCRGYVSVPWTLPEDVAAEVSAQLAEIGAEALQDGAGVA